MPTPLISETADIGNAEPLQPQPEIVAKNISIPMDSEIDSILTLTIRLVKSFEYRTFKNLVLHHVSSSTTIQQLQTLINEQIMKSGWKPYLNHSFDTLKIYVKAHGTKSMNLIINLDADASLILDSSDPSKCLKDYDIGNSFKSVSHY